MASIENHLRNPFKNELVGNAQSLIHNAGSSNKSTSDKQYPDIEGIFN